MEKKESKERKGETKPEEAQEEQAQETQAKEEETTEELPEATKKEEWIPKTKLGQRILKGEFKTLEDVLKAGELILESGIVDYLVPDLKSEIIYIGGSPGKGGGIRRTATKRTVRVHKSGRRFKLSALVVVGNSDGIVGLGKASSQEHRLAIEKATEQAKLNVIKIRRSCGSWECGCEENHSIPFKTTGKSSSVRVELLPAPRGVGIVANKEAKKILELAGIKDIWVRAFGQTRTRTNLIYAIFNALKNLNATKGDL
ncbi:MAG: 30S ribosomal protein S5 [Candidatus Aenigmatarchaeota archaeon]|nr:MAG: 30S ribosomal protein S5 [Candidatus Aenigmarchaeota archaeon]RLJ06786.1 MAG: 30S ribosomal protein S5 [Candidatus Aenigmarchaeota archaeon]RLJ07610.1 MAG: 30S ribosomal protein S5 [Candidatus Aenigmarchaeota archaeon]